MKAINSQLNFRRKLLKTVVIGSGVLGASGITMDKWLTPVIGSVVLPAHAQTSISGRYFMLNPDYPIHSQAQTGVSAQLASASVIQRSPSVADALVELLISSASAATVPPSSSTARLELYLEHIGEDRYKFVFLMTTTEGGLALVLYGEQMLQSGNNTIHLALCDGDPKPFPLALEFVSEVSASVIIAGESFELGVDSGATTPVKQECSKA